MKTQHPTPPSASITVSDLRFSYGPTTAESPLVDINELTFLRSRITVLTGENGSGKTTVLKLLAGLLVPDAGTISSEAGAAPLLVHQRPYIFADSVLANVMWPLRIRRIPRREARARATAALAHMRLDHLSHR
nr:ATP-binding cassette domain-containing protein [Spirochaeta sp.]